MRMPAILFLLATCTVIAFAQNSPPALVVAEGTGSVALSMSRVNVDARILDSLADTTMTMTFSNPKNVRLEGDLLFPLPKGATVCGYALDIDGKMVDGVVVERERGQEVYQAIVRRKIDPGLLEWVEGSLFRTRVFPIPPTGSRTVSVRYVTDLATGDGVRYRLPLKFKGKVGELHLRVEVARAAAAPKISAGALAGFAFKSARGGYCAEATAKDAAPTEDLVIDLGSAGGVAVEQAPDGRRYFRIAADLPRDERSPAAAAPRRITIFWDASGSRANQDHAREIRLLRSYFAQLSRQTVTVNLVVFRHEAAPPQQFTVEGGRADAILRAIEELDYDGGTQLASLSPSDGVAPPDLCMVFTDGVSTWGQHAWRPLRSWVYVFSTGTAVNREALWRLVWRNGGAVFDLDRVTDDDVLSALARPGFRLLGPRAVAGRAVNLFSTSPEPATGRVSIVGRLESPDATVMVSFEGPDRKHRDLAVTVSARDAVAGGLLRYVWAQNAVANLMSAPQPDEKEIVRLGREYGVVTPYTSLIVLDSVDQYLQYDIRPPDMLPEMQKAYDQARPALATQREAPQPEMPEGPTAEERAEDRLTGLLIASYFRATLWDKEPKYPADFRYKPSDKPVSPGGVGRRLMDRIGPIGRSEDWGPGQAGLFGGGGGGGFGGSGTSHFFGGGAAAGGGGAPRFQVGDVTQAGDQAQVLPPGLKVTDLSAEVPGFDREPVPGGPAKIMPEPPITPLPVVTPPPADEKQAVQVTTLLFDPTTAYMKALSAAGPDNAWAVYMAERKKYAGSPAFFIDCADFFFRAGQTERGIQVMSNIAELGYPGPMRTMAYRLIEIGMPDLAAKALEEAGAMQPDGAESVFDLAMLLSRQGRFDRAAELLFKVATGEWLDLPVDGTEVTALLELNRLIPKMDPAAVQRLGIDRRLVRPLEADLRVLITWDSGEDGVDLSVTEPSGEKCWQEHAATTIGGQLWLDVPVFGPEEYTLRRAMPGTYKVELTRAKNSGKPLFIPVMVQVDVFTDYGRPNEKRQSFVRHLLKDDETITVTEVEFRKGS